MTKHTPEPWELKTFDKCQTAVFAENMLIAIVSVGEGRPNGEANAKLIAAAPKLLAALQHGMDCRKNLLDAIRAGQTEHLMGSEWIEFDRQARAAIATATRQE